MPDRTLLLPLVPSEPMVTPPPSPGASRIPRRVATTPSPLPLTRETAERSPSSPLVTRPRTRFVSADHQQFCIGAGGSGRKSRSNHKRTASSISSLSTPSTPTFPSTSHPRSYDAVTSPLYLDPRVPPPLSPRVPLSPRHHVSSDQHYVSLGFSPETEPAEEDTMWDRVRTFFNNRRDRSSFSKLERGDCVDDERASLLPPSSVIDGDSSSLDVSLSPSGRHKSQVSSDLLIAEIKGYAQYLVLLTILLVLAVLSWIYYFKDR